MANLAARWATFRAFLPEGLSLPEATWQTRHRFVVWTVAVHAAVLPVFGLMQGWHPAYALGEGLLLALLCALAARRNASRRWQSGFAAVALVTSSAILVQFSGGFIEAHFHYFVVVALVTLYQDWVPFLLAIVFVGLSHGVLGQFQPTWVYNHPHAMARPWEWAAIHAAGVLAECAALLAFWSGAEQARERSDLLLASAGEGILGLDPQGRIRFANPAATAMLGRSEAELVGKDASEVLRPHEGRFEPAPGSIPVEGVVPLASRDLPVEWIVAPVDRRGVVLGHVVIVRDVSTRMRAEEERRTVQRLTEQNRFKSQVLNVASHELNTPIAILWFQLHWLRNRARRQADPALEEAVVTLEANVKRLADLVRDTLDVARLENGRMPMRRERADLALLTAATCRDLSTLAARRKVRIEVDGPEQAPADVDPGRIQQVMFNLVGNAVKFTRPGTAVGVRIERRADTLRFAVRDHGPGVPTDKVGALFQPFAQVVDGRGPEAGDEVAAGLAGTGLGLHISKGIVEAHGGTIGYAPAPGGGSTFFFELPVEADPAPTAEPAEPRPAWPAAPLISR